VRLSVLLIVAGMLGVVAGAWLIGRWAVGIAVVADSASLAAWGLLRDMPERPAELRRRGA
jgi:hypothetical protein